MKTMTKLLTLGSVLGLLALPNPAQAAGPCPTKLNAKQARYLLIGGSLDQFGNIGGLGCDLGANIIRRDLDAWSFDYLFNYFQKDSYQWERSHRFASNSVCVPATMWNSKDRNRWATYGYVVRSLNRAGTDFVDERITPRCANTVDFTVGPR